MITHPIIIVGSEGFVGKSLSYLHGQKSSNLIFVDKLESADYQIDIITEFSKLETLIKQTSPSCIINLAAFSNGKSCILNRDSVYQLNVEFVEKLAYACHNYNVSTLVHSSSEWIYGSGPFEICQPIPASNCYGFELDLYSRSKLDSELLLNRISRDISTSIVIYRFGIIYGTSLFRSNCVVDYLLSNLQSHNTLSVNHPNSARCFISVEDICDLLILTPSLPDFVYPNNVFNIQGPSCYSLGSIISFLEGNSDIIDSPLPNTEEAFDIKLIKSDFDFLLGRRPKCLSLYLESTRVSSQ